tara:strand:- start:635 stop:874 length:240 start_codon:yes stop_codon:yes gene_type:complete
MKYQIFVSNNLNKKYYALLENGKKVHFGDNRYQQYKDKTTIKKYKHLDHNDEKRKKAYYARHGEATPYSAKYFSHKYLW